MEINRWVRQSWPSARSLRDACEGSASVWFGLNAVLRVQPEAAGWLLCRFAGQLKRVLRACRSARGKAKETKETNEWKNEYQMDLDGSVFAARGASNHRRWLNPTPSAPIKSWNMQVIPTLKGALSDPFSSSSSIHHDLVDVLMAKTLPMLVSTAQFIQTRSWELGISLIATATRSLKELGQAEPRVLNYPTN